MQSLDEIEAILPAMEMGGPAFSPEAFWRNRKTTRFLAVSYPNEQCTVADEKKKISNDVVIDSGSSSTVAHVLSYSDGDHDMMEIASRSVAN